MEKLLGMIGKLNVSDRLATLDYMENTCAGTKAIFASSAQLRRQLSDTRAHLQHKLIL